MPERVGFKVLPISTKSRFLLRERPETVGEEQEPPCMYAGEASEFLYSFLTLIYIFLENKGVCYPQVSNSVDIFQ